MKILELADLHINPQWIESQKPVLHTIIEQGKTKKPDIICIAGDIYDRPFYNSEKDNITFVRRFIRDLLDIAPVVMVTGTPSHDAPGSYGIFEEMGCTVLYPAKPKIIKDCLFIGLPEITKEYFISKHSLPSVAHSIQKNMDLINQKMIELLYEYIKNYWSPVREENKHLPCVFLGHGVFVDNPNDENPIIKNTDIVIDNNVLKEIKADRYIFGHIHTPIQSKILNGGYVGYAGFDRSPWNNTGFQPGFNVTEIEETEMHKAYALNSIPKYLTETKRIPYPVNRKEKIKMDFPTFKKMKAKNFQNCDVRITLKIKKSELVKIDIKQFQEDYKIIFDCNSCEIVPDIIKEESQRITREQADNLNTLWEKYSFFKDWLDPSITGFKEGLRDKINEIEKNVLSSVQQIGNKTIKLLHLEVYGSIFSLDAQNKNCFSHDFSKDPTGLTLIAGDNGQGKSTFFGFASPYPVFLGWDYRSLKEFFPEGGHIKKRFDVDGVIHEHQIYINNKIECFWYENTKTLPSKIPFVKASQLKPFMAECERFFGPITSFVSTSFFAQEPWRMKNYVSSITSSSTTELRNAYLEIIGISREWEKEYAHEKVKALKTEIHDIEIRKYSINDFIKDKKDIEKTHTELKTELNNLDSEIGVLVFEGNEKEKEFDDLGKQYKKQNKLNLQEIELQKKIYGLNIDKDDVTKKIKEFHDINIDELKQKLADNDKINSSVELLRNDWQNLNKVKDRIKKDTENNKAKLDNINKALNKCVIASSLLVKDIDMRNEKNKLLNNPCFYCKKIDPENSKKINENIMLNTISQKELDENNKNIELLKTKKLQIQKEIDKLVQKLPDNELKHMEEQANELKEKLLNALEISNINNSITEYSKLTVYQENLKNLEIQILNIEIEIKDLKAKQDLTIEQKYVDIERELSGLKIQISDMQSQISNKKGTFKEIKKQLEKIKTYEQEINIITGNLEKLNVSLYEWKTIYDDMFSNKLPALELQLIAEEIDCEVNQKLAGKYIINTITQDINKKGDIIDRFDILVYNPKSGIEKSLLAHSPGQRAAYFIEPISQALREKRQKREGVEFLWSVADETDNPIKYERVREYYEIMNQGLSEGHTRFITSQKSEIYQHIKNTINIEEIGKNI